MKKLYKLSILALFVISATGCKKYLDINYNPSVPQVASAELLLSPIQFQMTNGTSQDNRFIWKVTQDQVGISTSYNYLIWEQHGYPASSDLGGVIWRMTYLDLGLNLENLINDAVENQKYEYAGIGYAIKAWAFQQCTDLHGPIILDEAFDATKLSFNYQDQPEVYAKVREWGNLSLKYLNMTSPKDYSGTLAGASGDQIYKGDKEKWKKFVYGLFAQQYSHLINKPEFASQYADSVVKYVDLSFANESESATVNFGGAGSDDTNPMGPNLGYLNLTYYGYPTTQILSYLTGGMRGVPDADPTTVNSVDPRLERMIAASNEITLLGEPIYRGAIPTLGGDAPVPKVYGGIPSGANAFNGRFIFADAARYPLMTYSQLQFAKAEAQFIKGSSTEAYTSYVNGIKGHMDFCNIYGREYPSPEPLITTTEINAYLASSEVAQSSADLTIADIMGQKYISQWGWAGLEQWSDIRKYHYDPLVYKNYYQLGLGELFQANEGKYAYRFRPRYNSEYIWNSATLEKFGGLEADYMTKETWFSQP